MRGASLGSLGHRFSSVPSEHIQGEKSGLRKSDFISVRKDRTNQSQQLQRSRNILIAKCFDWLHSASSFQRVEVVADRGRGESRAEGSKLGQMMR